MDSTEGQNGEVQTVTESTVAVLDEEIPEQLEYTITGDKGTIEVAAEVKMPEDCERCTVMELSIDYLEDEDIVTFADQIFDEGSYFLFMPYNQEEKQFLRDKLITASANVANDREKLVFEWVMEQLDGDEYFVESEEEYEELKFYPNHRLDDESEFCQLFGTIDGINYFYSSKRMVKIVV